MKEFYCKSHFGGHNAEYTKDYGMNTERLKADSWNFDEGEISFSDSEATFLWAGRGDQVKIVVDGNSARFLIQLDWTDDPAKKKIRSGEKKQFKYVQETRIYYIEMEFFA